MAAKVAFRAFDDPQMESDEGIFITKQHNLESERPSALRRARISIRRTKKMPTHAKNAPKQSRPFGFRAIRKGSQKKGVADDGNGNNSDDDPVMLLFEARSTQRVRFSFEDPKESRRFTKKENLGGTNTPTSSAVSSSPSSSIKKFMKGALFSKGSKMSEENEVFDIELRKEIETAKKDSGLVWENDNASLSSDLLFPGKQQEATLLSFWEDQETRANVIKLTNKARRAQVVHFRFEYAVKCYVNALELLKAAKYPDDHPMVVKTMGSLNHAHHAVNSYKNSANIVKMGIKYEDAGELVRALKMYTIAYRIRRDTLSRAHPSLVVLLNMLGTIQIKRGELEEAMQIYELALRETPPTLELEGAKEELHAKPDNLLARSVTFREMGTIFERWGKNVQALKKYHESLDCVAQYKGVVIADHAHENENVHRLQRSTRDQNPDTKDMQLSEKSIIEAFEDNEEDNCSLELHIGSGDVHETGQQKSSAKTISEYDRFFPPVVEDVVQANMRSRTESEEHRGDFADVNVALTLHQVGQLHRAEGEYDMALSAYTVALRGMQYALGEKHPNAAAILGNMGNLQKEMGDMDAAFETYQQVLGIESYRLGLSHPDVVVTLHNIATIDAARGNNEHALALYKQVINLQRTLFGEDNHAVSVTSACMGDVYERVGDIKQAIECFEEAIRIKTTALGRHSLEVARLLHKLGKLSAKKEEFHHASSFISRSILVYRLNKLSEEDEWVVDAYRDAADIDGAIALGKGNSFEC